MADVSPGYLGRSSACPVRGALFRNGCSSMARAPADLAYVAGDDETGRGDRDIWGLAAASGVRHPSWGCSPRGSALWGPHR